MDKKKYIFLSLYCYHVDICNIKIPSLNFNTKTTKRPFKLELILDTQHLRDHAAAFSSSSAASLFIRSTLT